MLWKDKGAGREDSAVVGGGWSPRLPQLQAALARCECALSCSPHLGSIPMIWRPWLASRTALCSVASWLPTSPLPSATPMPLLCLGPGCQDAAVVPSWGKPRPREVRCSSDCILHTVMCQPKTARACCVAIRALQQGECMQAAFFMQASTCPDSPFFYALHVSCPRLKEYHYCMSGSAQSAETSAWVGVSGIVEHWHCFSPRDSLPLAEGEVLHLPPPYLARAWGAQPAKTCKLLGDH